MWKINLVRALTGVTLVFFAALHPLSSADTYTDIDEHLRNNRLSEARSLLQLALVENGRDPALYLRLAAISEYQGDHRKAITTLESGLQSTDTLSELLHYNIGNNLFALRQYTDAERAYSAAINADLAHEPSYINRANARVWQENYIGAIEDYTHYLAIAPQGEHRSEVKQMIAVLRSLIRAEEERERERVAREKQALDDALLFLEDSRNDSLGTRGPFADIDELDDEFDIID